MMRTPVFCNVFEKTNEKKPPRFANEIASTTKAFLKRLKKTASEDLLDMQYQIKPLPGMVEGSSETEEAMRQLSTPEYDADFAFCIYPDVNKIGPEIAYLIHRQQKEYRHVFILTEGDAPDQDETIFTLKQISQHSIQEEESGLVLPSDVYEGEENFQHPLSFWKLRATREDYIRKRMLDIITFS